MFFNFYKDLFECPCPKLDPALPFRSIARDQIVADLLPFFKQLNTPLVYVADHAGGLLFDFILINRLLSAGFKFSHIIIIEPLKTPEIVRAQKAFQTLRQAHGQVTIFQTWDQYALATTQNSQLRGTVLITIDPENAQDLPDLENRHPGYRWHQKISCMQQPFFWATLFQQELPTNNNRHLLTGTCTQTARGSCFTAARHRQGHLIFDQQDHRAWLNHRQLLPFDPVPSALLWGDQLIHPEQLPAQLVPVGQFLRRETDLLPVLDPDQCLSALSR